MDRSARIREPAVHRSPFSENTPNSALSVAWSRSASAKMTHGDLPPSSIDRPLRCGAAAAMIVRPVPVSPVNEMRGTPGCATSAAPATSPMPCTRLNTPSGRPALVMISGSRLADSGVHSAGLSTTVQPDASAGASFQVASMNGVFHGVIRPATRPACGSRSRTAMFPTGRRPRAT